MDFLSKIHPLVVHFPVALFIIYFLFELISLYYKEINFDKVTTLLLGFAILFALGAVLTGNKAAELNKNFFNNDLSNLVDKHETFATITLFFYTALLFTKVYLQNKKKFTGRVKYVYLTMVLIGNIFIYLTGYYGGRLVFDYGLGTSLFK